MADRYCYNSVADAIATAIGGDDFSISLPARDQIGAP